MITTIGTIGVGDKNAAASNLKWEGRGRGRGVVENSFSQKLITISVNSEEGGKKIPPPFRMKIPNLTEPKLGLHDSGHKTFK